LTASELDWNRVIAPDASADIGFNGTWTGEFTAPEAHCVPSP
jgi:hypothetical protein